MGHPHVLEKRYSPPCERKKQNEITGQRSCCGCPYTPSGTVGLSTSKNMRGLGVSETKDVRFLGFESFWSEKELKRDLDRKMLNVVPD